MAADEVDVQKQRWWTKVSTVVAGLATLLAAIVAVLGNLEKVTGYVKPFFISPPPASIPLKILVRQPYALPPFLDDDTPPQYQVTVRFVLEKSGSEPITCTGELRIDRLIYTAHHAYTPATNAEKELTFRAGSVTYDSGLEFSVPKEHLAKTADVRVNCGTALITDWQSVEVPPLRR